MNSPKEIYVIANNIRSLYNVGSLFRLCDGVGVKKLFLCGTTGAPFDRIKFQRQRQQIAKTALEGLNNVDWEYDADAINVVNRLKKDEVQIVVVEQTPSSQNYTEVIYQQKVAFILGNEVEGVESEVIDAAHIAIELPMKGKGKSLNVISAGSAVLYHVLSQTTDK